MTDTATPPPALDARARCGKCDYNVTGLDSLTCPECGSDLRRVGIINAAEQRRLGRGPLIAAAVLFTFTVALAGGLLAFVIEQSLPVVRTYDNTMTLKSLAVAGRRYTLEAHHETWGDDVPPMEVTLSFYAADGKPMEAMRYDPATNTSRTSLGGATWAPPQPFTLEALLAFEKSAGVDDTDATAIDEAKTVFEQMHSQSRTGHMITFPGRATGGMSSNNKPLSINATSVAVADTPPYATTAFVALLVVLWLAGLRALWRYSRAPRGTRGGESAAVP